MRTDLIDLKVLELTELDSRVMLCDDTGISFCCSCCCCCCSCSCDGRDDGCDQINQLS